MWSSPSLLRNEPEAQHGTCTHERETRVTTPSVAVAVCCSNVLHLDLCPLLLLCVPSSDVRLPLRMSSCARSWSSSVSGVTHDVLWERALASLPAPLVRALRDTGLADASVLLAYPLEEEFEGSESGQQGRGLEAPSGAASTTQRPSLQSGSSVASAAIMTASCGDSSVASPVLVLDAGSRSEASASGSAASATDGRVLEKGRRPENRPVVGRSYSPLREGLASPTATSPVSVRQSTASSVENSTGHDVPVALPLHTTNGDARDGLLGNSAEKAVKVTGSGLPGDEMMELASPKSAQSITLSGRDGTELATPKTAKNARVALSLADRLLLRRFAVGDKNSKNSRGSSEDPVHAVDGHCMSADQLGQSGLITGTRVDGHPVLLSDRILERRFSVTTTAQEKPEEQSDGCGSQASMVQAKVERRRDGSVGRKGSDGSAVCSVASAKSSKVVSQSLCPPATATATAPLDGATIFPTCTPSPTADACGFTNQEHSTTRAARATTTFHTMPPYNCPVVSVSKAGGCEVSGKAILGTLSGVSGTDDVVMEASAPEDRGASLTLKRECE